MFGWIRGGNMIIQVAPHVAPASRITPRIGRWRCAIRSDWAHAVMPGWPLALPGEIVATPVVADLLGDGHSEVVVPCEARDDQVDYVNPHPNPEPLLFAFRADGSVLPGWPIRLSRNRRDRPWGGVGQQPVGVSQRRSRLDCHRHPPAQGVCHRRRPLGAWRRRCRRHGRRAHRRSPRLRAIDPLAGNLAVDSDGNPIGGFGWPALDGDIAPASATPMATGIWKCLNCTTATATGPIPCSSATMPPGMRFPVGPSPCPWTPASPRHGRYRRQRNHVHRRRLRAHHFRLA